MLMHYAMATPYICRSCRRDFAARIRQQTRNTAYATLSHKYASQSQETPKASHQPFLESEATRPTSPESSQENDKVYNVTDDLFDQLLARTHTEQPNQYSRYPIHRRSLIKDLPNLRNTRRHHKPLPITRSPDLTQFGPRHQPYQERGDSQFFASTDFSNGESRAETQTASHAKELDSLLKEGQKPFHEIWEFYIRNFVGGDNGKPRRTPFKELIYLHRGELVQSLMSRAVGNWCDKLDGPNPIEALQTLTQRYWRSKIWGTTVWIVSLRCIENLCSETTKEHRRIAFLMLMELWRNLFHRYRNPNGYYEGQISGDWTCIPDERSCSAIAQSDGMFLDQLLRFCPAYHVRSTELAMSALVTLHLLRDYSEAFQLTAEEQAEYRPFRIMIAHCLRTCREPAIHTEILRSLLAKSSLDENARRTWIDITRNHRMVALDELSNFEAHREGIPIEHAMERSLIKRLARVVESQKSEGVSRLWTEVQAIYKRGRSTQQSKRNLQTIPVKLWESFLSAYVKTADMAKTLNHWNEMAENGIVPTTDSWTTLLIGCSKSKNYPALERIWSEMLSRGVSPDIYVWTARIHGLFNCNRYKEGFRALRDMGSAWEKEAMTKAGQRNAASVIAAKPDARLLNAIIPILARGFNSHRLVGELLAWAKPYQIEPNVELFNNLMTMELRSEDGMQKAMTLLQQMERQNVKPDVVTFTIILQAVLESDIFATLDHDQQKLQIFQHLNNLVNNNLKPNNHLYSIIVNGLLKYNNEDGVNAIINHMSQVGLFMPAAVADSLLRYYFAQSPPNIFAVDVIWNRIISSTNVVLDHRLCDTIIHGYYNAGEMGKIMAVLLRMSKDGRKPTWRSLRIALSGLLELGDLARARQLVEDVRSGAGQTLHGIFLTSGYQESRTGFWKLASQHGLGGPLMSTRQHPTNKGMAGMIEDETNSLDDEIDSDSASLGGGRIHVQSIRDGVELEKSNKPASIT
jgi:pentatricopeptide repeat protein